MEIIGLAYCFDFPFTAYLLIPDYQRLLLTCPFATEVVTTGVLKPCGFILFTVKN